ncbi:MAG: hypothetical protein PUF12_09080 [Thermoflexaceae bacterium]|nr:hypothetical protein [Thermoflexaceae bacterium]
MNVILCAFFLAVGGLSIAGIYFIKKNDKLKKNESKLILGKKISDTSLMGTPTRYIVEVEYVINDIVNKRKIITTDKNILKCKNDEVISLLYVEKNNKMYWTEEKSVESVVEIVLLSAVCVFAFLLAIIEIAGGGL